MLLVMGSLFVVFGIILLYFLISKLHEAMQSKSWPYVWGNIQTAATRDVVVKSAGDRVGGHKSTQVDYRYTYEVDNVQYTNQRVTFSDNMVKTRLSLDHILKQYGKDQQVKVYYRTDNPSISVLRPGPTIYNFTPFITAIAFIGLGVWLAFFAAF